MILRPKPSLVLEVWWWALHGLLACAAVLVGWPAPVTILAVALVVAHGAWRRLPVSPHLLMVAADGACCVPEWTAERLELSARTRISPYWVELGLGIGPRRHVIVLLADQLDREDWARLRAVLERAHSATAADARAARRLDLS